MSDAARAEWPARLPWTTTSPVSPRAVDRIRVAAAASWSGVMPSGRLPTARKTRPRKAGGIARLTALSPRATPGPARTIRATGPVGNTVSVASAARPGQEPRPVAQAMPASMATAPVPRTIAAGARNWNPGTRLAAPSTIDASRTPRAICVSTSAWVATHSCARSRRRSSRPGRRYGGSAAAARMRAAAVAAWARWSPRRRRASAITASSSAATARAAAAASSSGAATEVPPGDRVPSPGPAARPAPGAPTPAPTSAAWRTSSIPPARARRAAARSSRSAARSWRAARSSAYAASSRASTPCAPAARLRSPGSSGACSR